MLVYQVFDFLKNELNSHFRNSRRWNENKVVISGLGNKSGTTAESSNTLSLSLIQISQEPTLKNYNPNTKNGLTFQKQSRPLTFHIDFILSANTLQYEESLKLLSEAILYFQSNSAFNHTQNSTLFDQIERLSISVLDLGFNELSNVWSMMGSHYLPSIIYRCRTITINSGQITEVTPGVSAGGLNSN